MPRRVSSTQVARSIPFDNSTNGFSSVEAQSAIEEAKSDAISTSGFAALASTISTVGVGKYLDFYSGLSSDEYPFPIPTSFVLVDAAIRTPKVSTISIGVYKQVSGVSTLILTLTLSNQTSRDYTNLNIAVNSDQDLLARVDSGSAEKPRIALFLRKVES